MTAKPKTKKRTRMKVWILLVDRKPYQIFVENPLGPDFKLFAHTIGIMYGKRMKIVESSLNYTP